MEILEALIDAQARGVAPPQNWTTRASDEIARLRYVLERMTAWYSSVDDTRTTQAAIDEMRTRARVVLGYEPNV
jgi:hypothetical protein